MSVPRSTGLAVLMAPAMPPELLRLSGREADHDFLRHAAEALSLSLDDETLSRLLAYRDGLVRWNKVYNLTAVRDPRQMLAQHLIDCLALMPPLRRQMAAGGAGVVAPGPEALRLLDVGSGGGLPGIVIALLQPSWRVTCVDAVAKKAAFIRQMAAELAISNLNAVHGRVESLRVAASETTDPAYDVITSRAFASLPDFTRLTRHLLAPGGVWVAMKGLVPQDELAALPATIQVFHVEHLALPVLDVQRCLVWMRPADPPQPTRA